MSGAPTCDSYAAILARISEEAYSDPEVIRSSPHSSTVHQIDPEPLDDP